MLGIRLARLQASAMRPV